MIYLIGSLRNPQIPGLAILLRNAGYEVFDDWYASGPRADDHWQEYEQQRGRTYAEALQGKAAKNVFNFDYKNLQQSDYGVLVLPAGKSAHIEAGFLAGKGRLTWVLFDKVPERWDVMYQFFIPVFSTEELLDSLKRNTFLIEAA